MSSPITSETFKVLKSLVSFKSITIKFWDSSFNLNDYAQTAQLFSSLSQNNEQKLWHSLMLADRYYLPWNLQSELAPLLGPATFSSWLKEDRKSVLGVRMEFRPREYQAGK